MKKAKLIPLLVIPTLLLSGCNFKYTYLVEGVTTGISGGGAGTDGWDPGFDDSGTYDIKIWVAETIQEITEAQVSAFKALVGDKYKLNITIAPMDEPDAASMMRQDVSSGADIYFFAQDQLAALKKANALAKMPTSLSEVLVSMNTLDSMQAATIDGDVWAMPATSDNGYFLYYNKSLLSETDVENVSTILTNSKDPKKRNKFFFDAEKTGYYGAAYYLATGCESKWTTDKSGNFIDYDDNYNSEEGLIASKGLKELITHSNYRSGHDASRLSDQACAVVSGIWDYSAAKKILGDDLGCTDLPSFTVDGKDYHLSSFDGYKMMGVKPQADSKKLAVCRRLALYLTNEDCQRGRFKQQSWGPSNKVAAQDPEILEHPALAALAKQHEYAHIQEQAPGAWFTALTALATEIKASKSDEQIMAALATYTAGLPGLLDED